MLKQHPQLSYQAEFCLLCTKMCLHFKLVCHMMFTIHLNWSRRLSRRSNPGDISFYRSLEGALEMYLQESSAKNYQQKPALRLELKCYLSTFIQVYKAQHLVLQPLFYYRLQFCCACDIPQRTSSLEYSVLESADTRVQQFTYPVSDDWATCLIVLKLNGSTQTLFK